MTRSRGVLACGDHERLDADTVVVAIEFDLDKAVWYNCDNSCKLPKVVVQLFGDKIVTK